MLSKILIFLSPLLFPALLFSQTEVFPYEDQKKWGILTSEGEILLKPQYDYIEFFRDRDQEEAISIFTSNYKKGILSRDGEVIIPARYERLEPIRNSHLFNFFRDGGFGVIDLTSREEIIPPSYHEPIRPLDKEARWFQVSLERKRGLWSEGKIIIPISYNSIKIIPQDSCPSFLVEDNAYEPHYFDCKGNKLTHAPEPIEAQGEVAEGPASSNDPYEGYRSYKSPQEIMMDKAPYGLEVVSAFYDQDHTLYARVRKEGKWGLLSESGELILEPIYDKISSPMRHFGIVDETITFCFIKTSEGIGAYMNMKTKKIYFPK